MALSIEQLKSNPFLYHYLEEQCRTFGIYISDLKIETYVKAGEGIRTIEEFTGHAKKENVMYYGHIKQSGNIEFTFRNEKYRININNNEALFTSLRDAGVYGVSLIFWGYKVTFPKGIDLLD